MREDDKESFDIVWGESGSALGTHYASVAQRRLENTEETSISIEKNCEALIWW